MGIRYGRNMQMSSPKAYISGFIRLAAADQRGLAIAYAAALAARQPGAGITDPCLIGPYGERYVRWDEEDWMVPQRFLRTAERALKWAEGIAAEPSRPRSHEEDLVVQLGRLYRRATGRPALEPARITPLSLGQRKHLPPLRPTSRLLGVLAREQRRVAARAERRRQAAEFDWLWRP